MYFISKFIYLVFFVFLINKDIIFSSAPNAQATALPACVQAGNCTYNISTVAGNGNAGNSGDSGAATSASLNRAVAVAADSNKNMYIADLNNNAIRRVDGSTGVISTIANIGSPVAITTDTAGNVYTIDNNSHQVLKIQMNGAQVASQTVIANNTNLNGWSFGIAVDNTGNVFVADYGNHQIKKLTLNNGTYTMSIIAGTGTAGFSGDGGPALNANLNTPAQLAVDSKGNIYVAERGNAAIRKLTLNADGSYTASTAFGKPGNPGYSGDGGPANQAQISGPVGVALDVAGNVYFSDGNNLVIRMVSASTGNISTIAGMPGKAGFDDHNGIELGALFQDPHLISIDSYGNIYIGDCDNNRIRKLTPVVAAPTPTVAPVPTPTVAPVATPTVGPVAVATALPACVQAGNCKYSISTFAGQPGQAGTIDGPLKTAIITWPSSFAFDKLGNTYFSGDHDNAVRKIDASGNVTTISANYQPTAIDVDAQNNLYVFDGSNMRILKYPASASKDTPAQIIAGNDAPGAAGYAPGALFNAGIIHSWGGLIVDPQGNIFISQTDAAIINKLTFTNGQWSMATIAGTKGVGGYDDNNGVAIGAKLNVEQLALDTAGNLYFADPGNAVIRKLTPKGDGTYTISTVAGTPGKPGYSGDGGLAVNAQLSSPVTGISVDAAGNLYINDVGNRVVRFVSAKTGIISTIAGTAGEPGYNDNNGVAAGSELDLIWRNRVDANGNLYIGDSNNHVIRKLTPITLQSNLPDCVQQGNCNYKIETVAGTGTVGNSGDGGPALAASFSRTVDVAVDSNRNMYISDLENGVIRRVDGATGTISTIPVKPFLALTVDNAGNVYTVNNDGQVVKIQMNGAQVASKTVIGTGLTGGNWSFGIAVDRFGNVYATDYSSHQIKKYALKNDGTYAAMSIIAGTGTASYTGDGGPAVNATFNNPSQPVVDSNGNVYVADRSNNAVRKLTLNTDDSYTVSTIAGTGQAGFTGDGGPANKAQISGPVGVGVDAIGNLYISDTANETIRFVSASTGNISTIAGTPGKNGFDENNGKALGALFANPHLISLDSAGNIYIGDIGNYRIRKLTPTNVPPPLPLCVQKGSCKYKIETFAGNGTAGNSGDGGAARAASLNKAAAVSIDPNKNMYIADLNNSQIRRIDGSTGSITTIAKIGSPHSVTTDIAGNVYTVDTNKGQVIKIQMNGAQVISQNVIGSGFKYSLGITADAAGNVFVADYEGHQIKKLTPNKDGTYKISVIAGTGRIGYTGDGGSALNATLYNPAQTVIDSNGNIYVADRFNHVIRKLTLNTDGGYTISTVAGTGQEGFLGDGGPANAAELNMPAGLNIDAAGNLYISDTGNQVIRFVSASNNTISTISGTPNKKGFDENNGKALGAVFANAHLITMDYAGNIYVSDIDNNRIRKLTPIAMSTNLPNCLKKGNCTYNISTFAGKPGQAGTTNGNLQTATINWPNSLALDKLGNKYFSSDKDNTVRKIDASGNVTTIITGYQPTAIDVDAHNNLYVFDGTNMNIVKYQYQSTAPYKNPQIIAGNDDPGTYSYTSGALFNAGINRCDGGLIVDPQGNVFISQSSGHIIKKLTFANGKWSMKTIAGHKNTGGYDNNQANGNAAIGAKLNGPEELALDTAGNIFIADSKNNVIRKLTQKNDGTYTISTVAGNGTAGYSGDGGPATSAQINSPVTGISVDAADNLYISDVGNHVVRFVSAKTGIISTIAGTPGKPGYNDNDGIAFGAQMNTILRNRVDTNGNLYIGDSSNHVIRKLSPILPQPKLPSCVLNGSCKYNVETVAGNGTAGNSGDDGLATAASLNRAAAVAVDNNNNMYIFNLTNDLENNAIRRVDAGTGIISTISNTGFPLAITTDNSGNVYTIDHMKVVKFHMDGAQVVSKTVLTSSLNLHGWTFGMNVDAAGNIYISDHDAHQIIKVTLKNGAYTHSIIAGTGAAGYTGDGGPAVSATFKNPAQMVVDPSGNIYVAERGNNVIRKLRSNADGSAYTVSTFAGTGQAGFSGDHDLANKAQLFGPSGVSLDAAGNVYIVDTNNGIIRVVTASTGKISTIAGTANKTGFNENNGKALGALFSGSYWISNDKSGNLFLADIDNHRIRKLSPIDVPAVAVKKAAPPHLAPCVHNGNCKYNIETIAGNGIKAYSGDEGPATGASLHRAVAVAVDNKNNMYLSDLVNNVIRRVDHSTGIISTIANITSPIALATDSAGNVYTIDSSTNQLLKIEMNGGQVLSKTVIGSDIKMSFGIAIDKSDNVYVSDYTGQQIQKLTLHNGVYTASVIAGTGALGYLGDGGPALSATFNNPAQLAIDSKGDIYVADRSNNAVRKLALTADGSYTISTVAGTGHTGFSGDRKPASKAKLNGPVGVSVDAVDNLYIADTANNTIRVVSAKTGTILTIAGTPNSQGYNNNDGVALGALFINPYLMSTDNAGNIYIGDCDNNRIRKLSPIVVAPTTAKAGATAALTATETSTLPDCIEKASCKYNIETIAGTSNVGYTGDAGPAKAAWLNFITATVVDNQKNVYIADLNNNAIRRIDASTGMISTIANVNIPITLTTDNAGNVFTVDNVTNQVLKIQMNGAHVVSKKIIASNIFNSTTNGIAVDSAGNIFMSSFEDNQIKKLTLNNGVYTLSTIAGTGAAGYTGDGGPAINATLNNPSQLAVDTNDTVYIADHKNHVIRKLTLNDTGNLYTISTVAGTGQSGFSGDGGPATKAKLNGPIGVSVDLYGNLYISEDLNTIIRLVSADTGNISTIAGTVGASGYDDNNGLALGALLNNPHSTSIDNNGNIYIGDGYNSRVRKLSPIIVKTAQDSKSTDTEDTQLHQLECLTQGNCQYKIETVAGNGKKAYTGDAGPAISASFNRTVGVAVDSNKNMYISDMDNNAIRRVDGATGNISTIAKINTPIATTTDNVGNIYTIDNSNHQLIKIQMNDDQVVSKNIIGNDIKMSFGIAVDSLGNVYVSDYINHQIKKLSFKNSGYTISIIAGTGAAGYTGDGGPALSASFNNPSQLAIDSIGNIYVADRLNHAVRKLTLNTDGTYTVSTVAGTGKSGFSGDDSAANKAQLNEPVGVSLDATGNLYIADTGNNAMRIVSASTGTISTIAGTPNSKGFNDNSNKALGALFVNPNLISIDTVGNIYIGDCDNQRIRKLEPKQPPSPIPSCVQTGTCSYKVSTFVGKPRQAGTTDGPLQTATITWPASFAFDKLGNSYFGGHGDNTVRKMDAKGNVTTIITGYQPTAIDVDAKNNLYVFDGTNMRIVKYSYQKNAPYRNPQIIAGNDAPGTPGYAAGALFNAGISHGWGGLVVDPLGNIFISQSSTNIISKLSFVNDQWSMATIAGKANIIGGYDDNKANNNEAVGAKFNGPEQLALDTSGNIFIADKNNNVIRKLTPKDDGTYSISTVVGNGNSGFNGDDGLATRAQLNGPTGISVDSVGNLYISDVDNSVIRFVSAKTGIISTIAGTPGTQGYDDNDGVALGSQMGYICRNKVDMNGNLYVGDANNHVIRKLSPINVPTTAAVTATPAAATTS